jgi:protocatechuate 3,4-dioxygenase beta subunit
VHGRPAEAAPLPQTLHLLPAFDDEHRAAIVTATGEYGFESNFPPGYASRPPHIHIRVSAEGYRTLVTQHYPKKETSKGSMDLVLIPEG